jgi:hypothetical protein
MTAREAVRARRAVRDFAGVPLDPARPDRILAAGRR